MRMRSVVSQGCRPIGRPLVVTKCERNLLIELGGKPALEQLRELWPSLSEKDQKLVQSGLHVGLVINEYQEQFSRGDFLVRNVVGVDPERGIIAMGDYARVGQTVQFHVRDAQTADEDLRELLAHGNHPSESASPKGALLFTCNGRGTRLFSDPHHDARSLSDAWPELPAAGFFAQGEIGPIGGKNFLHGFTASIALFEPVESA
jgi:small ligand-binding sensory domain FIST